MNEERFFDLAMKVVAQHATDAERAELDELLAANPELSQDLEQLRTDVSTAKETLPLVNATKESGVELPGYARRRLQSKVRQTLGQPAEKKQPQHKWSWGWILGFAAAAAVLVFLFVARPVEDGIVVQVAMLDTAGGTRGGASNELSILQQVWSASPIQSFNQADQLSAWENELPLDEDQSFVKVVYDRNAAEVRVAGRVKGRRFEKVFPVEPDLAVTLRLVDDYVREQTGDRR